MKTLVPVTMVFMSIWCCASLALAGKGEKQWVRNVPADQRRRICDLFAAVSSC